MIQAKNLHKYYDKLHVLKGVDLHIEKGEIVSIVGASGAGKTTLLQILGTLDKPNIENGTELQIDGENILHLNDKALSRFRNLKLGFIFQFHQLYLNLRLWKMCAFLLLLPENQKRKPKRKPKDF